MSDSLLDMVMGQLDDGVVGQIAGALGADQSATSSAIGGAVPALIAAMAQNSANDDGATSLFNALGDHDGSALGGLGDLLGGGGPGAGILGHVLGGNQANVQGALAARSGLPLNLIIKLLPVLAPLVLGALGKMQRQRNLDAGGVRDVLDRDRRRLDEQGDIGDILGSISGDGPSAGRRHTDADGGGGGLGDLAGDIREQLDPGRAAGMGAGAAQDVARGGLGALLRKIFGGR